MLSIQLPFFRVATLVTVLAAALISIAAQEIRDRQLTADYDLTTIQMPVEIVSIRLNGKEVRPGEKITGDDNWLRGVSFTVKNISGEPLSYVNIGFKFPLPNGFVVVSVLNYGFDSSHGDVRRGPSPLAIAPGENLNLVLTKQRYDSFLHVLTQAEAPHSFEIAPYFVQKVCFENQPDVFWEYGYLKRRNPADQFKPDLVGPYVLPGKQAQQHHPESSQLRTTRSEQTRGSLSSRR